MTDREEIVVRTGLRPGSIVFGVVAGLLVALASYQWITDTERRERRASEEAAVLATRSYLSELVAANLEIVDPLAPERSVGKAYVYAWANGWEVSGFYRRGEADRWHAFLATLDSGNTLLSLKLRDTAPALKERARDESRLAIVD